jgi:hypothetical protein
MVQTVAAYCTYLTILMREAPVRNVWWRRARASGTALAAVNRAAGYNGRFCRFRDRLVEL